MKRKCLRSKKRVPWLGSSGKLLAKQSEIDPENNVILGGKSITWSRTQGWIAGKIAEKMKFCKVERLFCHHYLRGRSWSWSFLPLSISSAFFIYIVIFDMDIFKVIYIVSILFIVPIVVATSTINILVIIFQNSREFWRGNSITYWFFFINIFFL